MTKTKADDGYKPKNLWTAMAAVLAALVLIVTRFEKLAQIKDFATNWEEWVGVLLCFALLTLGVLYLDSRKHLKFLQEKLDKQKPLKEKIAALNAVIAEGNVLKETVLEEWEDLGNGNRQTKGFFSPSERQEVFNYSGKVGETLNLQLGPSYGHMFAIDPLPFSFEDADDIDREEGKVAVTHAQTFLARQVRELEKKLEEI